MAALTLEEAFPRHAAWLARVASGMTSANDWADLEQEGLIAMWRALEDHDPARGPVAPFMRYRAKRRMIDVVNGKALFGDQAARPGGHSATTKRGEATRKAMRAHLAIRPRATGVELAAAVGVSQATISKYRRNLNVDDVLITGLGSLETLLEEADFDAPGPNVEPIAGIVAAEVRQVVDVVLTENEKRYVRLRFWEDAGPARLRAEFGYDPSAVWPRARARLQRALADVA